MKFTKTVPFFIFFLLLNGCNSENPSKNRLLAPTDWRGEILEFPLKFASILPYSGIEYVRFAPDWGKNGAQNYFSYVFLWEIDQNPKLSSEKLESEMEIYFDGLMNLVSKMNLKLLKKIPETKAFFEKVNDSLYVGKIITYDAFTTKKEVRLHAMVTHEFCSKTNKYLVLFNISPQKNSHPIWKKMQKITFDGECL